MRLGILIAAFAVIYAVVAARLVQYGLAEPVATAWINTGANAVAARPTGTASRVPAVARRWKDFMWAARLEPPTR